jgi:hypothetical protein
MESKPIILFYFLNGVAIDHKGPKQITKSKFLFGLKTLSHVVKVI